MASSSRPPLHHYIVATSLPIAEPLNRWSAAPVEAGAFVGQGDPWKNRSIPTSTRRDVDASLWQG